MNVRGRISFTAVPLARLLVGGIFLIAGFDKVEAPGAFADAVRAFHLLPPNLVLPFALILPWIELLVALYLLVGFFSRVAAGGAILLLLSFVVAIGNSLLRGDTNHACGCFGSAAERNTVLAFLSGGATITWWDLIRDLLLIALAGGILILGAGPFSVDALLARRREGPDPKQNSIAERGGI